MSHIRNKLSIPLTVDATLESSNGYLFGILHDKTGIPTWIDVRRSKDNMPALALNWKALSSGKNYEDMTNTSKAKQKAPVFLCVRRLQKAVVIFKDESMYGRNPVTSYFLRIQSGSRSYFTSVCTNGLIQSDGDERLLDEIQNDAEFSKYISFIPQPSNDKNISFKKWNLNEIFKQRAKD